jgi:Undecaprenyl-phosphate glucose phosphotransferase
LLRRYSEVFRTLCAIADLLAISAAFATAYVARFQLDVFPEPRGPHESRDYVAVWLASLLIYHVLLRSRGLYAPRRRASRLQEIRKLLEVSVIGTGIVGSLLFFSRGPEISRLMLVTASGLTALALVGLRSLLRFALVEARKRGFNTRSVAIVGTGWLARDVHERLRSHPESGFQICGFIGPRSAGPWTQLPPILGPYESLHDIVTRQEIDQVFIALDRDDPADPMKILENLHDTTVSVRIALDLSGLGTIQAAGEDLDGLPVLCVVDTAVVGWGSVAKRSLDIGVAAAGLVLCAPLLGAIALAIRLTSPDGPVLFRQRRVSLDAREFTMLKFRTMVPGAERETGPTWARPNDPRCTPVGAFLRRTSLDELPQLWNVLLGQMSLVGPRPERPELIRAFRSQIPGYMRRHKMKGGLTGLAQVHGCRGNTPLADRIAYDIRYAAEWSFLLDLRILVRTAIRFLRDPNAY